MAAGSKEKRPVRVTIANQSFTLITSGEDSEVLQLANEVDELIAGIARRSTNADTARLAILACLHLADRLHTAEEELKLVRGKVQARARKMEGLLAQVVD